MTNLPAEVSNAALYVAGACSVSPAGFFSAALSPACPANAVAAASSATAANIDLFMLSPLRFQISDFRLQTSDFRLHILKFLDPTIRIAYLPPPAQPLRRRGRS